MKSFFLTVEEAIKIHDKQVYTFGGALGIRDYNLLVSAMNMPMSGIGETYFYSDLFQMSAAYAYYIIKNHPFIDGNKRTGMVISLSFLEANKLSVNLSQDEVFNCAIQIATSKLSLEEFAIILSK